MLRLKQSSAVILDPSETHGTGMKLFYPQETNMKVNVSKRTKFGNF